MKNLEVDIVRITLEPRGIRLRIALPEFEEKLTNECKRDIEELRQMSRELADKVTMILKKYNPTRPTDQQVESTIKQVIEALAAAFEENK